MACHGNPTFLWWDGATGGGGDVDFDFEVVGCPDSDPECKTEDLSAAERTRFLQALQYLKTTGICGQMRSWAEGRLYGGYVKKWAATITSSGGTLYADIHYRPLFGINDLRARLHIWETRLNGPFRDLATSVAHEFMHAYLNDRSHPVELYLQVGNCLA